MGCKTSFYNLHFTLDKTVASRIIFLGVSQQILPLKCLTPLFLFVFGSKRSPGIKPRWLNPRPYALEADTAN